MYVTNSPAHERHAKTLEPSGEMSIFLLPGWIYSAFTNRYNLVDVHDYGKLRSVLSLTDLAHLEILRRHLFDHVFAKDGEAGLHGLSSFIQDTYWQPEAARLKITLEQQREVDSAITYLLEDKDVQTDAMNRLRDLKDITPNSDSYGDCICAGTSFPEPEENATVPYRVIHLNGSLYIIVEEGFLTHIVEKAKRLAFLTTVLKSAYAINPVHVVNCTVWYRQYLAALAAK